MHTHKPKYVFLSGSRGSGVEFVHSILDSHPQVLAIPFPVMIHYFWRLHNHEIGKNLDELFDNICTNSGLAFVLNDYKGAGNKYMSVDNRTTKLLPIDGDSFRTMFKEHLVGKTTSRRNIFTALYRAYAVATGVKWENIRVVLENSHNTFFHKEILEDFPDAKFVSPIRDPHAIFASCRKGRFGNVYEGLSESSILMHLYQTFINQEVYHKILGDERYLLIKNENIHTNKEKEIRRLAEWLGIDYHEALNTTTFAGSPWGGNSAYREKISNDIGKSSIDSTQRWMKELRKIEVVLVEYLFGEYINKYEYGFHSKVAKAKNYQRLLGFLSFFVPVKGQLRIRGVGFSLSKGKIVKYLEYFLYPLSRAVLYVFYKCVRNSYLKVDDLRRIDPDQNFFPKLRHII